MYEGKVKKKKQPSLKIEDKEPEVEEYDFDEIEPYGELPDPNAALAQFDPVTPTSYSVVQDPLTIGNPLKKKKQGGLNQFSSGLTIKSKLLNI